MADVDPDSIQNREELGAALTTLRLRAGLTVRDLAARTKLPSATVGGYVTARHLPSPGQIDQFRAVLQACGVEHDDAVAQWDQALVRVRVASDGRAGRRRADSAAPYRGLKPFEPDDVELFFGREEFVGLVLARLADLWHAAHAPVANGESRPRLLFVIGASGSGKSSALRAGVYPAVLDGTIARLTTSAGEVAVSESSGAWSAAIMVPGSDPRAALAEALDGVETPRLLVIDQFEELYTLTADEAEQARFVADLAALGPDTLIVAGLRADFFPAAARDAMLVRALQDWQIVVPPMSESELRSVIVGPAAAQNVAVEDGLIEAIIADVFPLRGRVMAPRQNALPLLSHALLATWELRRRGRLTLADYRSTGGLAGAVQHSAEEAYAELSHVEQELARRVFLRLSNVDDELLGTRRRVIWAELDALDGTGTARRTGPQLDQAEVKDPGSPGSARHVLERFVSRRLVTVDETAVEVSHDALLTAWPRLAEWISADHAGLRVHRRLTSAANAWQDADFDDHALMRGTQLAGVEEWARDPDHRTSMNRLERDYLIASVNVREAEHRAAQHRASVLRRLTAALAALLLVAVASTAYALHTSRVANGQRQAANLARNEALSREVAIESTRAATTDQALAQQLALAAYRISPTVDARSALLDATATGVVNRLVGSSGPTALRLNPAGTLLAVSNVSDGAVALYRYGADRPGPRVGVIPAQAATDQVFALSFSPDGRLLAVGGAGGKVRLFDVTDPTRPVLAATAPGSFGGAVEALAFNPAGTQLVAGGSMPPLRRWTVSNPVDPSPLPAPAGIATGDVEQTVAFSPDGSALAAGGSTGTLELWRATNLDTRPRTVTLGAATLDAVVFSPDSRTLITGSKDGTATIVDAMDPTAPHLAKHLDTGFTSWANTAAYSPDGRLAALGGSDGKLDVFDTATGARAVTITNSSQITAVEYSVDGRTLLAASADGTVRSWPVSQRIITGLSGPVFGTGYDATGSRLAVSSAGKAGSVTVWSIGRAGGMKPTEIASLTMPSSFGAPDGTVAISGDGHLVATGNISGQVLLDTLTAAGAFGQSPQMLSGARQTIESIAFSPGGHIVAAGSDDGYVHLWDVSNPNNPSSLPGLNANGEVVSIAFSPNGQLLAAASVDHRAHLWRISDPAHPQALPNLTGFANYAWSVAFSPDSNRLAAGGADDTIRIWDVTSPQRPRLVAGPLSGPTHYVFALAFSPDGKTLAAAGGDGTVWTWALSQSKAPQPVTTLHDADPGGSTYTVTYSPDGATLTAAGSGAQVVLWTTNPDTAAAEVCATGGDQLTPAEWSQYVPGANYQQVCASR